MKKSRRIITASLIVLICWLVVFAAAGQTETRITKTFYAKNRVEVLEIAEKYLSADWDYINISKTIWKRDRDKGYKYEVDVTKYER